MGKANNWTSSSVRPKYTTGGNASQTPKKKGKKSNKEKQEACNSDYSQGGLNFPTSARYQGWTVSGIKRFNELFDAIEKERASCIGSAFDKEFLQYCIDEREQTTNKQKHDSTIFETCRHELWVDDTIMAEKDRQGACHVTSSEARENKIHKRAYESEEDISVIYPDTFLDV
jgi:hypothetical protein